jgi:peptidoglycan/LPS O-acetylase OafA/YrhL
VERPQSRRPARTFLPEVQALRALAVALVVLYHFWPHRLTGGFVGVDVFFVISGFLITSHLYRELAKHGRVSMAAFYARRARRLLPAAVLVLLATGAASLLFLPVTRWAATAGELLASTFYVQNWALAARAVDYSASADAASAVQHFWSLSVEEQFYLAWPPLIMLLVLVARRTTRLRRDDLLLGGILLVSLASLAWSVYATTTDPAAAYFQTPTRIWELGAGAVLALWTVRRQDARPAHRRSSPAMAIALRWGGVVAVLVSAITLSAASAFPGYLALVPVLGTVAVIAAGDTGRRDPLLGVADLRPVRFLGDVSYSLYLWHWPFVVIAPFALGHPPAAWEKVGLLAVCVALAWATKVAVEQPAQRWRLLVRPRTTALATALAMLAVSGVAAVSWYEVRRAEDAALARLAAVQDDPCFGAAAVAAGPAACADAFGAPAALTLTDEDKPWFHDPACEVGTGALPVTCRWSDDPPTARVALIGDSHAEHWRGAIHAIAEALNWEVVESLKGACPVTPAPVLSFRGGAMDPEGCHEWGQRVIDALNEEPPDYIFTSAWAGEMTFGSDDPAESLAIGAQAFADTWRGWEERGSQVVVLRDVPATGGRHIPECLVTHPDAPTECARPRAEAVTPDALTEGAARAAADGVQIVDLTDFFCDETTCYPAIGGAIAYWDRDHISAQFSRTLAPFLRERIDGLG